MTDHQILWLDLETTGISETAQILEIGMIITKGLDEEIARYSVAVRPPHFNPLDMPTEVLDMHSKSLQPELERLVDLQRAQERDRTADAIARGVALPPILPVVPGPEDGQ